MIGFHVASVHEITVGIASASCLCVDVDLLLFLFPLEQVLAYQSANDHGATDVGARVLRFLARDPLQDPEILLVKVEGRPLHAHRFHAPYVIT